jgi:hypothetical protein
MTLNLRSIYSSSYFIGCYLFGCVVSSWSDPIIYSQLEYYRRDIVWFSDVHSRSAWCLTRGEEGVNCDHLASGSLAFPPYKLWLSPPCSLWTLKSYKYLFLLAFFFFRTVAVGSGSIPWATLPAHFVKGFFEIGSHKLFAQADFELQKWSFWSVFLE